MASQNSLKDLCKKHKLSYKYATHILKLKARGYNNKEIAETMNVHVNTVHSHVRKFKTLPNDVYNSLFRSILDVS